MRERKRERERERETDRQTDRNVENLLESKNFVLIDENGNNIITFKFTQRKYALVIMTGISRLSIKVDRPPLWSSGQSFWLQIQRSRVRFPALPDFLSSSGSGTGSTQPREVN